MVTAGGRVLTVSAVGASFAEARRLAYEGVGTHRLPGAQHRTDIALRAEERSGAVSARNVARGVGVAAAIRRPHDREKGSEMSMVPPVEPEVEALLEGLATRRPWWAS